MSKRYILVEVDDSNLVTASDYQSSDTVWGEPRVIRDAIISWTPFGYADIRTADVTDRAYDGTGEGDMPCFDFNAVDWS